MPSPAAETPVFDPSAIDKLRSLAGDEAPGFIAEMADLFLTETRRSLPDLQKSLERGDWKAVKDVAHSLKSSAATLGAMRLSTACRDLETDTSQGAGSPHTPRLVACVLEEFDHAARALDQLK